MKDTPEEILQKQREILFQKTNSERFLIGTDLIDFGIALLTGSIRRDHPELSETEVKIETFKRCYADQFEPEVLNDILRSIAGYGNRVL
jgi:hypothetical protein